jgi:hypothetical protein
MRPAPPNLPLGPIHVRGIQFHVVRPRNRMIVLIHLNKSPPLPWKRTAPDPLPIPFHHSEVCGSHMLYRLLRWHGHSVEGCVRSVPGCSPGEYMMHVTIVPSMDLHPTVFIFIVSFRLCFNPITVCKNLLSRFLSCAAPTGCSGQAQGRLGRCVVVRRRHRQQMNM